MFQSARHDTLVPETAPEAPPPPKPPPSPQGNMKLVIGGILQLQKLRICITNPREIKSSLPNKQVESQNQQVSCKKKSKAGTKSKMLGTDPIHRIHRTGN